MREETDVGLVIAGWLLVAMTIALTALRFWSLLPVSIVALMLIARSVYRPARVADATEIARRVVESRHRLRRQGVIR